MFRTVCFPWSETSRACTPVTQMCNMGVAELLLLLKEIDDCQHVFTETTHTSSGVATIPSREPPASPEALWWKFTASF